MVELEWQNFAAKFYFSGRQRAIFQGKNIAAVCRGLAARRIF
jgi:hypothetical protein